MPYRLIYSSAAAPDLDMADLEAMLAEFRARNSAHGITGVLVFVDGVFLQILEGERNEVLDLMRRIERDPRHNNLKVFHREDIDEPAFASWSMAYLSPSIAEVSRWAVLDGATTARSVLTALERNPDHLQQMVVNLIKAIADA